MDIEEGISSRQVRSWQSAHARTPSLPRTSARDPHREGGCEGFPAGAGGAPGPATEVELRVHGRVLPHPPSASTRVVRRSARATMRRKLRIRDSQEANARGTRASPELASRTLTVFATHFSTTGSDLGLTVGVRLRARQQKWADSYGPRPSRPEARCQAFLRQSSSPVLHTRRKGNQDYRRPNR